MLRLEVTGGYQSQRAPHVSRKWGLLKGAKVGVKFVDEGYQSVACSLNAPSPLPRSAWGQSHPLCDAVVPQSRWRASGQARWRGSRGRGMAGAASHRLVLLGVTRRADQLPQRRTT